MKKLFLLSIVLIGINFISNAQDISKNAIGLRLGSNDGFGTEISYQRGLSDSNRLELDLGWRSGNYYDGFKLAGLYQWVWNIEGDFNWYVGVGGGLASYEYGYGYKYKDRYYYGNGYSETYVFAAGDIGIEYNFDFPLQISLDTRPELGFGDYRDGLDFDLGLGIRYQF